MSSCSIRNTRYAMKSPCSLPASSRRPAPRPPTSSRRQLGFTLIEVMVVVVIVGIMAALIVPNLMDRPDQARAVAARQDIGALMQALKLYRLDNGRYPTAEQGLPALMGEPQSQGTKGRSYLDQLPNDPWGMPYQYLNPGVHGEIDVFSFGADGRAGGEGINADIGSWAQ